MACGYDVFNEGGGGLIKVKGVGVGRREDIYHQQQQQVSWFDGQHCR